MNLKLGLFNLKKNLRIDQLNESKICQVYLENFENVSEKEFYNYIKKDFNPYTYDKEVVSFLEAAQKKVLREIPEPQVQMGRMQIKPVSNAMHPQWWTKLQLNMNFQNMRQGQLIPM